MLVGKNLFATSRTFFTLYFTCSFAMVAFSDAFFMRPIGVSFNDIHSFPATAAFIAFHRTFTGAGSTGGCLVAGGYGADFPLRFYLFFAVFKGFFNDLLYAVFRNAIV